ncbi:hypothetical protein FHW69_003149 [Luteibacter sp. Sphag1AF]|uniref:hypothetical protein n=1 Tax=Luteibacter sp. Sphag1AF TaxID=2587031 RepID=UPI00161BAEEA|nr:hypothetical protein [Luteibacter sp. Sphag1AF]MBB3228507.1 hypothetical protein [Luteibacter sp. Sphag1AF]
MKKSFLMAAMAIAATQSACSTQYRIDMDPNAFLATWNRDMHGPDMTLRRQPGDGDATLVSDHWLVVKQSTKDNAWMLTAPEAVGPQTCSELFVAALGISRDAADALIARGQKETQFQDGNLNVTVAHEGGMICRAAVVPGK